MPRIATGVVAATLALAIGSLAASAPRRPGSADRVPRKPNVIVVMTDDQTVGEMRFLPKTQALIAAKGTTFANSFVSYSLCCPSRATFLTGQYAHNDGVRSNTQPYGGYRALNGKNTLAVWLQRAGYYTILIGKYLNGYGKRNPRQIPPGWSEWHGLVDPTTYHMYGYTVNDEGQDRTYGTNPQSYQTNVLVGRALASIRRRAHSDKPFFMWLAVLPPHDEHSAGILPGHPNPRAAPGDIGRYDNVPLPQPPSFNEADVSDKPKFVRNRALIPPWNVTALERIYHARADSLVAVDDGIAQIVSTLKETGQLGRTAIIVTSDNGFLEGEHRLGHGKFMVYEPSIRVPLVMRVPGIPGGRRLDQLVGNTDLAPTIAALAHATPRRVFDGVSLLPLLRHPRMRWRRSFLLEAGAPGWTPKQASEGGVPPPSPIAPEDSPPYAAVRTARWKYVRYVTGETELYDLKNDPYELRNLSSDPRYTRIKHVLRHRLAVLRTCKGAVCRRFDHYGR